MGRPVGIFLDDAAGSRRDNFCRNKVSHQPKCGGNRFWHSLLRCQERRFWENKRDQGYLLRPGAFTAFIFRDAKSNCLGVYRSDHHTRYRLPDHTGNKWHFRPAASADPRPNGCVHDDNQLSSFPKPNFKILLK